jgi:hypothetical protein
MPGVGWGILGFKADQIWGYWRNFVANNMKFEGRIEEEKEPLRWKLLPDHRVSLFD